MVELHESLKGLDVWQHVATATEKALKKIPGLHGSIIAIRAMGQPEIEKLGSDSHFIAVDDRFEFAFNVNEVHPPEPHRSTEGWVMFRSSG